MNNSALIEAFNKKYGMTPQERKSVGITDEEYENNKKLFAEKWYAQQEGQEAPKVKLKETPKATPKPSATPRDSDVYKEFSRGFRKQFGFKD